MKRREGILEGRGYKGEGVLKGGIEEEGVLKGRGGVLKRRGYEGEGVQKGKGYSRVRGTKG